MFILSPHSTICKSYLAKENNSCVCHPCFIRLEFPRCSIILFLAIPPIETPFLGKIWAKNFLEYVICSTWLAWSFCAINLIKFYLSLGLTTSTMVYFTNISLPFEGTLFTKIKKIYFLTISHLQH